MLRINSPHFKKVSSSGRLSIFCVLTIVLIPLSFPATGETSPKFLIFHLDAVSSQNFFQYMEDGYLSNLKAVFEDGNMIHYGLSLFPI